MKTLKQEIEKFIDNETFLLLPEKLYEVPDKMRKIAYKAVWAFLERARQEATAVEFFVGEVVKGVSLEDLEQIAAEVEGC